MGGESNCIYQGGAPDTFDYGNGGFDDGTGSIDPEEMPEPHAEGEGQFEEDLLEDTQVGSQEETQVPAEDDAPAKERQSHFAAHQAMMDEAGSTYSTSSTSSNVTPKGPGPLHYGGANSARGKSPAGTLSSPPGNKRGKPNAAMASELRHFTEVPTPSTSPLSTLFPIAPCNCNQSPQPLLSPLPPLLPPHRSPSPPFTHAMALTVHLSCNCHGIGGAPKFHYPPPPSDAIPCGGRRLLLRLFPSFATDHPCPACASTAPLPIAHCTTTHPSCI